MYTFTAGADAEVTITTCSAGTAFDTVLYVREAGCAAGAQVAVNDDDAGCVTTTQSTVTFCVSAGTSYWVFVDGAGGADGAYDLIFSADTNLGDVRVNLPPDFTFTNPAPEPGDPGVDVGIQVENLSAAALTNVRVDLLVDPATELPLPTDQAVAPGGNTTVAALPATSTATPLVTTGTSAVEAIWRLWGSVNTDGNVVCDPTGSNVEGPQILGWADLAAGSACGDCNQNGVFDILDALQCRIFGARIVVPQAKDFLVCDVDNSGVIDIIDAFIMARETAGILAPMICPADPQHLAQISSPTSGANIGAGPTAVLVDLWEGAGMDIDTVTFEYSPDGITWYLCDDAGGGALTNSGGPAPTPAINQDFNWDTDSQFPVGGRPDNNVQLRVTATITAGGSPWDKVHVVTPLNFVP